MLTYDITLDFMEIPDFQVEEFQQSLNLALFIILDDLCNFFHLEKTPTPQPYSEVN